MLHMIGFFAFLGPAAGVPENQAEGRMDDFITFGGGLKFGMLLLQGLS